MNEKKNLELWKAKIALEKKYTVLVDHYNVDTNEPPLADKFYSKYPVDSEEIKYRTWKIQKLIEYRKNLVPRDKYYEPICESHCIGWHLKPLWPMDRNDTRFFKPKVNSDLTKHAAKEASDKVTARDKFIGTPFITR